MISGRAEAAAESEVKDMEVRGFLVCEVAGRLVKDGGERRAGSLTGAWDYLQPEGTDLYEVVLLPLPSD